MIIYLVRHGETEGNRGDFHQTPRTPLTEHGILQAKKVAERLKVKEIDLIYSSTHDRAIKTAEFISKTLEIPIEPWGNLKEIKRPEEVIGKNIKDPEVVKIDNLVSSNFGKKGWKYSDEENFEDLNARAKQVLDHLLEKHSNQTVLCVTHGTFIKVLVSKAIFGEKLTPNVFSALRSGLRVENTGVSILRHTGEHGWGLISWNDTNHL